MLFVILAFRSGADMLAGYMNMTSVTTLADQPAKCVLDHDTALARAGGDAALVQEIASLFLENYGQWMTELREAVARGDPPAIARSAHGIKGSVANFGAAEAVKAAFQLEQAGRNCDLREVAKVLDSLELALAVLRPELEAL